MSDAGDRFLFVHHDPGVLTAVESVLVDTPDEWTVDFALGGAAGVEALDAAPYDVLVTDMCMPEVDGLAVLRHAVETRPGMTRVVRSGDVGQEVAQEAMDYAHEFLSKPCDEAMLLSTLRRCAALAKVAMPSSFRDAVGAVGSLPSRPKTHARALEILDAGGSFEDLAELISQDMAMCTKVLHVANTAYYSRGRPVQSVVDAVRRLGSSITSTLLLSVETYETIKAPDWLDIEGLHRHSLEVGMLAAELGESRDRQAALLGGLLHDVGELLIASYFPQQGERALNLIGAGIEQGEAERRTLGFEHGELGAHLFRLWNLGEGTAVALEQHHAYGTEERGPVSLAVVAADYACHQPQACDLDERLAPAELEWVDRARVLRTGQEQAA